MAPSEHTPHDWPALPVHTIILPNTEVGPDGLPLLDEQGNPRALVPYLVSTTLEELGTVLPHGRLEDQAGGGTTFEFRPPVMGTRKRQGAVRADRKLAKSPGIMLPRWIGVALLKLGDVDVSTMKPAEVGQLVGQLPVGDVLYLASYWQWISNPTGMPLGEGTCGACGAEWGKVAADLGGLSVDRLPDDAGPDNPPRARVSLDKGVPFPAGAQVSQVLVRPATWAAVFGGLSADNMGNGELINANLLRSAICAVDTSKTAPGLTPTALDELWPHDQRAIQAAQELIHPSPDLEIVMTCPSCGHDNSYRIDWTDPGFTAGPA